MESLIIGIAGAAPAPVNLLLQTELKSVLEMT